MCNEDVHILISSIPLHPCSSNLLPFYSPSVSFSCHRSPWQRPARRRPVRPAQSHRPLCSPRVTARFTGGQSALETPVSIRTSAHGCDIARNNGKEHRLMGPGDHPGCGHVWWPRQRITDGRVSDGANVRAAAKGASGEIFSRLFK